MCETGLKIPFFIYSGEDTWSKRWAAWGLVRCECKDEHIPCSFCRLWLQICDCHNIFWGAGVSPEGFFNNCITFFTCIYYFFNALFCFCRCPSMPPLKSGCRPTTPWRLLSKCWTSMRSTLTSAILYPNKVNLYKQSVTKLRIFFYTYINLFQNVHHFHLFLSPDLFSLSQIW